VVQAPESEVAQPIHFAAETLRYGVILTSDPVTMTSNMGAGSAVINVDTKFERNGAMRAEVIAISICDLMTLNM